MKIKKLTLSDSTIPERLRIIHSPPKELYVLGDLEALLEQPALAVVGSRKVSPYGRHITKQLVQEIAGGGVVVISGLALGIDSIAHQAALDAGGKTIAVLPSGLDKIYPSSHYHLAKSILAKGGALVTEYPPRTEPFPSNFVARNRLVAGLSNGVLITEAAEKSGTLHTANFALDQGKTVMAVPGNITSLQSRGTNNLIKTGALAVVSTEDILEGLGLSAEQSEKTKTRGDTKAEQGILDMLANGITDSTMLHGATGLNAAEFNQALTMLEITGKIKSLGAGHWALR